MKIFKRVSTTTSPDSLMVTSVSTGKSPVAPYTKVHTLLHDYRSIRSTARGFIGTIGKITKSGDYEKIELWESEAAFVACINQLSFQEITESYDTYCRDRNMGVSRVVGEVEFDTLSSHEQQMCKAFGLV